MTEQSIIERVARAMWDQNRINVLGEVELAPWDSETVGLREDWLALARAAIAAMRDPTEAMNEAGRLRMMPGFPDRSGVSYPMLGLDNASSAYQRMIDAALNEDTSA